MHEKNCCNTIEPCFLVVAPDSSFEEPKMKILSNLQQGKSIGSRNKKTASYLLLAIFIQDGV